MLRKLTRTLCFLSGFLSLFPLLRFPTAKAGRLLYPHGKRRDAQPLGKIIAVLMFVLIEIPKLLASALAPFLAFAGAVGATLAIVRSDPLSLVAGLIGVVLSTRHIRRVTAPQNAFAQTFGSDWRTRISDGLAGRLAQERWRFPTPIPPPPGARLARGIVYGVNPQTNETLLCDVWQPPQGIPRSGLVVVYFHAGAWGALERGLTQQPLFHRLVGQGHVVVDAAYTLAPRVDIFSMVGDVKQAVAWIKANAARYGVDQNRVILMGASGGGHLALLAAYTPNHPTFQPEDLRIDTSVRAVVALYAPTDMIAHFNEYRRMGSGQPEFSHEIGPEMLPRRHDHTGLDRLLTRLRLLPSYRYGNMPGGALLLIGLLGGTPHEVPHAYHLASPLFHAGPGCPPTLQIFGAHDFYFSPAHGQRLHRALREQGATSIYIELPETDHGFDHLLGQLSPAAQAAAYDIEHFLALMAG